MRWKKHYSSAKSRCNNPNDISYGRYGGKGTKMLMTMDDFKLLWFRDKAHELKRPSIDRIDSKGHYTLENCRFIELSENSKRKSINKSQMKPIRKMSLGGKVLQEYKCIGDAVREFGLDNNKNTGIGDCARGKAKTAYGYRWAFI